MLAIVRPARDWAGGAVLPAAELLGDRLVERRLTVVAAESLGVAQDRQAVGVAGEGADAEGCHVDGVFGEDALVDWIWVGAERGIDRVKDDLTRPLREATAPPKSEAAE